MVSREKKFKVISCGFADACKLAKLKLLFKNGLNL